MEKTNYFGQLENNNHIGPYKFPDFKQYEQRAETLRDSGIPDNTIAIEAQRDWHTRGQNGCNFARIAARKAIELGWKSSYIDSSGDIPNLANVDHIMKSAEADEKCEIISLVFEPMVAGELVNTLVRLTEESEFYLEKDELIDNDTKRQLYLRYPLALGKVASWSMGFAPYEFMPATRKSPYIEIATRMKTKPDGLHELLNQKEDEAHLADLIIDKTPKHTGHRILTTIDRTAKILQEKPNHITAAKSTLTVPVDML